MTAARVPDEAFLAEVTDVLAEAFEAYPVMRWVLGPERGYAERLRAFVGFSVRARVLRDEPIVVEPSEGPIDGAALVSYPGVRHSPPELVARREAVWTGLGAEALTRYTAFTDVVGADTVDVPHVHLNMIGVRGRARGTGLGRRLVERVHALSRELPWSRGVHLTTENPTNVSLYEHLGYRLVGHSSVTESLETWSFFRPDDA